MGATLRNHHHLDFRNAVHVTSGIRFGVFSGSLQDRAFVADDVGQSPGREVPVNRITALATALALVTGSVAVAGDLEPVSYDLAVDVDPSAGAIDVVGDMVVRRSQTDTGPIEVLLHDTFTVRELRVNGRPAEYRIETRGASRLQPAARTISFAAPKDAGRTLEIEIAYGGVLRRLPEFGSEAAERTGRALDDAVSTERVELASYSTWYPVAAGFGPRFDTEITIALPVGWTVVSVGEPVGHDNINDRIRWTWSGRQVQDLVILAAPDFTRQRLERGKAVIEIYSTELPPEFIRREAKENGEALELFVDLLGPAASGGNTVRKVFTPRKAGQGGYSRAPLIVISEGRVRAALSGDPELSLLKGTAHEAAHFWWSFGTGQGDWINEAFAEYFALVAVEGIRGHEAFERALARTRTAVGTLDESAPPLAEVPMSNDGSGYTIRYYKGALLVHALRVQLGDDAFFSACREFHAAFVGRGASTDDLRRFWSERLGDAAPWLDRWLDTPGGELPMRPTGAADHPG
jgi:hypothetical protein